jgi:hypothetical protein
VKALAAGTVSEVQALAIPAVAARYRPMLPAIYWTVTAIGVVWCVLIVFGIVPYGLCGNTQTVPCDAYSFWAADGTPYVWETNLEYRYSPAFLWMIYPFQAFPFEVFLAAWTAGHIAALIWLRAGWVLLVPGLNEDVLRGNISTFLALAAVLAIERSAGWWSAALLTKVTPSVGLVWHAVRGEWRSLAWCLTLMLAIVGIGFAIAPHLWVQWFGTLAHADATYEIGHPLGPLWLRVAGGTVLVAFAARTTRAWLIPVAMFLAVPGLWAFNWGLLAGVPRLVAWTRAQARFRTANR